MKSICVYCGSNAGSKPAYTERAIALGDRIAKEGLRLVYGGGNVGLMGIVADAVLAAGGEVVGVIPETLVEKEFAKRDCTELHVVDTMHERKRLMAERADAFLALPFFNHMHRYLPALFKRDGWEVAHVDVTHRPRGAGRSNYSNIQRALVGIVDLAGVAWLLRRRKKARVVGGAE